MSKLFFLGAGKMATAIAGGLVKAGTFQADELLAFDVNPKAAEAFQNATGIRCVTADCKAAAAGAETVLLAVKPQMLADAVGPLWSEANSRLFLSIVAGVSIDRLTELTGSERIVRIMPNTPMLVGRGAAGFSAGPKANKEDIALTERILASVGIAFRVDEKYMDAVTALSGSGPAYVFEFIQALADGGVSEGLPRDMATQLAAQTVLGAAEMVLKTGTHPTVLKDQVTSPAGTTARALEVMYRNGFAATVIDAMHACARRSEELGKK